MQKVFDFIKSCRVYYIATMDGDQPRVRPFGTIDIYDGKIYFLTGKNKQISKQIGDNPKIEICAYNGDKWIRVQAVAIEDETIEAKQQVLNAFPFLQDVFKADDDNTQVFYLSNAVAMISSFEMEPEVIKF